MASKDTVYEPRNAFGQTIPATTITGAAGLVASAIQNTLTKQNVGAFGIFMRTGGTVATFAAMGGAFEFIRIAAANLREKEDSYNQAIGGFCAGAILGLRFRSFPAVLGIGAGVAILQGVFDYAGGSIRGYNKGPDEDEFERKERLRKNRRRPIQEFIDECGEGRGLTTALVSID
ncbi:hypothetical protein MMC07_006094 [Pseudocyphellaria aurata]|nr:hypothetical protein [Pseudocyphellaria aurata]